MHHEDTVLSKYYDCIIIGGGAAGLMCAATAAARHKSVLILEGSNKIGKKILMSGGGRCNFTNYFVEPEHFISNNAHFCISALRRYTQYDFIALIERHQLNYHEKTLGQLFCDNKSSDILAILLEECRAHDVDIVTHCKIDNIINSIQQADSSARRGDCFNGSSFNGYRINSSTGHYRSPSLVIATGGLSIPSMGASGFGYQIAKQFGLNVVAQEPALVPLTLTDRYLTLAQSLAGVSCQVSVQCPNVDNSPTFTEGLLFTHKGLSGPAILQISNYWQQGEPIEINFLPGQDLSLLIEEWRKQELKLALKNLLARYLAKRFVNTWLENKPTLSALADKTASQLTTADIQHLTLQFQQWRCYPATTEGYQTAEVTRGGIDTNEVSSKTFEALKVPGLFFIGEVLDVTGWLGGYNFQWAWSSGYCAGQYV